MNSSAHTFHIPVMGLGFTIDTPVKVARFGISSVVSIIEDNLVEQMRKFYCEKEGDRYVAIEKHEHDYRARRITAYLDLLQTLVDRQVATLKAEPFEPGYEIVKYFEMLPGEAPLRSRYLEMMGEEDLQRKIQMQEALREEIVAGKIDVNIMTKCDRINFDMNDEPLPAEYADAMAALRGYASSQLNSSVVFSAGLNPRLYSYCESFPDFMPGENGGFKKKIILKVSDYRSALVQGKFLAKKGLWVSEFRVESGLNCGGHAFPTDGFLLGPIMEEFKNKKAELNETLFEIYRQALQANKGIDMLTPPGIRISVQGGIGTHHENQFLLEYFNADATGWGSPFLLVPEATNVDDETLNDLSTAVPSDYYLSHSSPLGVPFNNFRKSSSERQRIARIEKGRPGSPCYKKFLAFDTEFSEKPICTASREYQHLKLQQLSASGKPAAEIEAEKARLLEKDCLCEGLSTPVLLKNQMDTPHNLKAVAVCPGPNLAYFSGTFSLKEMIDHIYGRANILNTVNRPSVFLKELRLYADYYKNEFGKTIHDAGSKKRKQLEEFRNNMLNGIEYYRNLIPEMKSEAGQYLKQMYSELYEIRDELMRMNSPSGPVILKTPS